MKTNLFSLTAMLLAGIMVSCQQAEEPQANEGKAEISTRAYGEEISLPRWWSMSRPTTPIR